MDKSHIIETLRNHQAELNATGVLHLRIFGSVARNEASPRSDIDVMVDFDETEPLTLRTVGHIQSQLTDLLGHEVDLSSADWMKEPIRSRALREAVLVF
jgi:uncharacterized protein